jgi:Xaa-Pro aminopeptidase
MRTVTGRAAPASARPVPTSKPQAGRGHLIRIFSDAEMRRRVAQVARGLKQAEVDVAFVHTADNAYYVTGVPLLSAWGRPLWAIVWADGRVAIIGASIELESMEQYAWADEIRTYGDEADVWDAGPRIAADLVRSWGGSMPVRLGVERRFLSVDARDILAATIAAEQVDISEALFAPRLIKGDEELALLRLGGEIAKIGAHAFLEALSPGVPELVVAAHAVAEMDRALATRQPAAATSTYAYCQFGEHSLSPHHHPTGRVLRDGDIVALNVFPVIWGYCMELERTYIHGEPTREQAAALRAATDAFEQAKTLYQPGSSMRALHTQATQVLVDAGYGAYLRHGTGHAHGIMIGQAGREEGGELRSYNNGEVRPRMVNSIEPGIYIPGLGGFRHSDVMAARETGAELLTKFPTDVAL